MERSPLNDPLKALLNEAIGSAEAPHRTIPDETLDRYRFLADAMPLIVWTARPDGSHDYYNRRWYEYTGLTPDQNEEAGRQEVVHSEDLRACMDKWAQSVRDQRPYEIECRLKRHADGAFRWHLGLAFARRNSQGDILQWVGTFTDIDDQKRSELELRGAAQFAQNALNGLTSQIAVLDEQGRIMMVNAAWNGFTETKGSLCNIVSEGANYLHVCDRSAGEHAAEAPAVADGIRSVLSGRQDTFQMEYPCHSPTEQRWFNLRVTRFPEALPPRAIVAHEDITSRKLAEAALQRRAIELARATGALEQSNRELDQFAYVTSHDLKAPLRGIANLTTWIEEDMSEVLTGEARGHLALLRSRVNRMAAMIDGILQYSRIGRTRFKTESVDIGELLKEIIDLLSPPPEARISILSPMPLLVTDRLRVQQVFMNLIGNAIKHAGRRDVQIEISVQDAGTFVEFTVSDNGVGIAPAYHEKIFEIFQTLQARDKVEGSGIGLSIVKKIVEQQGGVIRIEPHEGRGAAFRFTLPKYLAEYEPSREQADG